MLAAVFALAASPAFAVTGSITAPGGGVISYNGAADVSTVPGSTDILLKFTADEDGTFEFPGMTQARIFAIGGGGGGGGTWSGKNSFVGYCGGGGGGGAGAVVETNDMFNAGKFTVSVGVGGKGGQFITARSDTSIGENGINTVIRLNETEWLVAPGGGGGGGEAAGRSGASGGGGSMLHIDASSGTPYPGGSGTSGLGFAGGAGDMGLVGGGGGGAGGPGADASTTDPTGGDGVQSDITGSLLWYAGGGAGGYADKAITTAVDPIAGGSGVGGNGGVGTLVYPTAGQDGTGSGGGGCCANKTVTTGGAKGGDGIVYVRVSASIAGGLKKPTDPTPVVYDGEGHTVYQPAPTFYTIDGQNIVTNVGLHTVTVTPRTDKGITWEGGSSEPVDVTLLIVEAGSQSGTIMVTGAPVDYFGAAEAPRQLADGDWLITFTGAGSYKLPGSSQARILAVGGGGGGGGTWSGKNSFTGYCGGGGGGGAGAMVETNALFGAAVYTVGVGAGGAGGQFITTRSDASIGANGGDTFIRMNGAAWIAAPGGGGGGGETAGRSGASGGGGSMLHIDASSGTPYPGGSGMSGLGFDGGACDAPLFGGGGGGAGGAGAAASTANPVGGAGRSSDITGETKWYAGGGGGGHADKSITTAEDPIAGGSGVGGNGGVGTLVYPTAGRDGTGSGGGGCCANKTETTGGAAGGSGIVYVRISNAMIGDFKKPTDPDPIVYDRNAHTSLYDNVFYTRSGDYVGTTAGVYKATATLRPGVKWPEDGSTDPVDIYMTILKRPVTISDLHIDDWEFRTPESSTPNPSCTADPAWAADVLAYDYAPADSEDWQAAKPTEKGDYRLRVRVKDVATDNYEIANPSAAVTTFRITPIYVVFSNLALRDWMYGTPADATPSPTCTVSRSDVSAVFEYKNKVEGKGGLTEEEWKLSEDGWSAAKPTPIGDYWVRVRAPDFENYDFDIQYADFKIFAGLGDLYADWVEVTVAAYAGEARTDYPYVLTLSEETPATVGAKPYGFLYERAGVDGETLCVTDAGGNPLPYKVVTWDVEGESQICVKLPTLGAAAQTLRLYWCLREGKKAPTHAYEPPAAPVPQPSCAFGLVCRDGLFVNFFTELPEMSKVAWQTGEEPGTLVKEGKLAEGTVQRTVYNAFTGETRGSDIPTTEVGSFRIVFAPQDPRHIYEPLSTNIDIRISGDIKIDNLRGTTGDETLNGRVLLANDDDAPGHVISNQGYWQTNALEYATYWDHGTANHGDISANTRWPYVLYGVNHTLNHLNADGSTNVIWRFKDVMIGNQFRRASGQPAFHMSRAYLPWERTARGISTKEAGAATITSMGEVGNLLLRNRQDAAVYSPCYTNGIGTIYFDVVRGQEEGAAEDYRIVVEVATNAIDAAGRSVDPTDANSRATIGESVFPNLDNIGPDQWVAQTIHYLKRDNSAATFDPPEETAALDMLLTEYGKTNNFYRVYVPVNVRGAARFRIRRLGTVNVDPATPYNDLGGFIVLDNVLVSYPQMTATVEPYGFIDKAKETTPRLVLGQETAFATPFPSVGAKDVLARAKPIRIASGLTNINEKSLIQLVRMHYRWRYLDQQVPADWQELSLSPANNFLSDSPITLPAGKEGDVEFWYETDPQVPYYTYYDYSGTGLFLGDSGYSEALGTVTSRLKLSETESLPSAGRDWFVRLRAGKSDYERLDLVVKDDGNIGLGDRTVAFELTGNHVWRAFLPTPTNVTGEVKFHVVARNLQTPGAETFATNTNYWKLAAGTVAVGGVGTLETAGADDWTTLEIDDKAGAVMIQVDDRPEVRSFVVVHGERQDFNLWTDANVADPANGIFVGQYELGTAGAVGTSGRTREFLADMTNWHASVAVDTNYWRESFTPGNPDDPTQLPIGGEVKEGSKTPNGWTSGPGKWAAGFYSDIATGRALQMQGKGYGYLQLTDSAKLPRGLKSISFAARLAQSYAFEDVCYWDDVTVSGGKSSFKDYTFVAKGAFDTSKATAFAGAASVSLLAYYRPGVGCYELRVTQKTAETSGGKPTGPGSYRTLQLYRWRPNAKKQLAATPLGAAFDITIPSMAATEGDSATDFFPMLFIACSNRTDGATTIWAGVSKEAHTPSKAEAQESAWVSYTDNSGQQLAAGTFGVTSCGCPARFCALSWYDKPVGGQAAPAAGKRGTVPTTVTENWKGEKPTWRGTKKDCAVTMADGKWYVAPDRFEDAEGDGSASTVGYRALTLPQTLEVYTAPKGTANWGDKPINTFDVTGFGSSGTNAVKNIPLYTTDDCSVRIKMGGSAADPLCDVVIDDVQIEQWRGESFDDDEGRKYFPRVDEGSPTNFVFTQAWLLEDASVGIRCQLNAKRSLKSVATSIRSPLMDGREGRGLGLGMISYTYANAQSNAVLLVQIATNDVDITTLADVSKSASTAYWTTLTNATVRFADMTADERLYGKKSFYLGLHGVKGLVRIALAPSTVDDVKDVTDPNLFGSVDILSVMCSDEPELDERSWWGWNLRTTDETEKLSLFDAKTDGHPGGGLAFALNDAVDHEVRTDAGGSYTRHLPFVQTSMMSANLIGEISFKARKYDLKDQKTYVVVYGAPGGRVPDKEWGKVASFEITSDVFSTYTHKIPQGVRYAALRLAVVGVKGIVPDGQGNGYMPGSKPEDVGHDPVRVLLDDVTISESIDARVAFRNVRPFRFGLDTAKAVTDIMSENEQPLVGESWGVQGEIYAAQLTEEVDLSTARVRLSWYVGKDLWGYDQWKESPKAKSAWLAESSDTERVFRSSYLTCPDAIVPLVEEASTVQYMLEVVWRLADGTGVTNRMEASDWVKPEWYRGVDYNAQFGQNRADRFAGYTLLDTVAPHWAWVNEANILGEYESNFKNTDADCQYVEIAAPAEADLTGWQVRMLTCGTSSVLTNTAATFGLNDLPGTKQDLLGQASGLVFRVIASPTSYKAGRLDRAKGEVDGKWNFTNPDATLQVGGEISWTDPFAVQLVRPSGIVEHELVLMGYNYWGEHSRYPEDYDPTNTVNNLNALMPGSKFFFAGADDSFDPPVTGDRLRSLSVCDGKGETNCWDRLMVQTPGRINTYADGTPQVLRGEPPTPAGDTVVVRCNLDGSGKLVQTVGTAVDSPYDQIIVMRKGEGTNITYCATNWYELGSVTTNGAPVDLAGTGRGNRRWEVSVGRGVSNGFTVVASAGVCKNLRDLGITDDNRYKDAIMDWFLKGVDMYGNPWPDSDDTVYPVPFRDLSFNFVTNLSITECYWLDICPTITNQHLVGGMIKPPEPAPVLLKPSGTMSAMKLGIDYPVDPDDPDEAFTNRKMAVFLMITNANPDKVLGPRAWSPYVIRSAEPGVTSWDFETNRVSSAWASGSFKISGILMNGLTSKDNALNWIPLRWFLFTEDSFYKPGEDSAYGPYTSEIEVADPSIPGTPGYDAWGSWVREKCGGEWPDVFFRWELNERRKMYEIEILKKQNYLSH